MAVAGHEARANAAALATVSPAIRAAVSGLGSGPLSESSLAAHIFPLFARVLARGELYLANHSLGRPLDQTASDMREFTDLWYERMDDAWGPWLEEVNAFRARYALLMGLDRADAVVPKSSAGHALRTVIGALPNPRPRIVATRGEFDSNDFILKVMAARGRADVVWVTPREGGIIDTRDVLSAMRTGPRSDLVCVSHVYYSTGQLFDAGAIAQAARELGVISLVDCYHSVGVLPFGAPILGADFAIGGSYKYIRGGPGPCWLAVHPRHLDDRDSPLRPTDTGWFAKRDTFSFRRPDAPEFSDGGDAWLEATPLPALAYQARAGLQLLLAIGVDRLRAYNLEQQAFLAGQLRALGVPVTTLEPRGAFLLVPDPDADRLVRALKQRGVNTDARLGNVRLCPDLLTTRDEMVRASRVLADLRAG
jgi:kynureninase